MKTLIMSVCLGVLVSIPNTMKHSPVPAKPFKVISEKELTCLAKNIFYEAPVESYEGKLAVATVTMNRVRTRGFPKTVCGVVYEKNSRGCQFSWTCGPKTKFNPKLYAEANTVAMQVLTRGARLVSIKNALYFHNTSVKPNWGFARPIKQIGNHIFYVVKSYNDKENQNRKTAG
jgi:spore germination cell wall hydrolase CwlJ-like protein